MREESEYHRLYFFLARIMETEICSHIQIEGISFILAWTIRRLAALGQH
jgi:hypothetical protein